MILLRKALRTIRENKAQFFGAFFMVLISSMLIVGMTMVSANLGAIFTSYSANNKLADAEFNTAREIEIEGLEHRFDALIEKGSVVDYELTPGQTLRIFSENTKVNLHALLEGHELSEDGILLDPLFAGANDLYFGDTLMLNGAEYKISGYMALPNYIYIIRSREEMINDPKTFGIAVLSEQNLEGLAGRTDFYVLRFNQRENIHEQELLFKEHLLVNGIEITNWESTENNPRVSYVALEVQYLSTLSKAIPGMLLMLSIVLIGILLNRMIQRESAVLGTLYALGYRKAEFLRHYLIFPLLIAGLGGLLGALLGLAMVKPMLDFMITLAFSMPVDTYQYNYIALLIGILTPVIVLCLSSYLSISLQLRAAPAELIKGARISDKLNFIERALKLERFGFNTKFQIREQVRSLPRTGFLLFGVVVATMLLLYGLTLQSSLDYMLDEGITALYDLKYEYVFKEIQSDQPPAETEQFNAILVSSQEDRSFNFYVVGALTESTRLRLKDPSGNKLIPDRVIITKMLADKLKVSQGDEIHFVDNHDLREYSLTVEALADSAAGEFVFMPLDVMNEMVGLPPGSYIGIWTDEQMEFPEGVISSTKSIEAIAAGIRELVSQTGILVYTLTVSAFVLGLIIIFLVTGMVIEESKKTISLFKIMGYRPKEVNKLILNSNTIVVVAGYLIGIPVLLVSVTALWQSLEDSLQMTIPARLNFWYVLFGFFVVMFTYQVSNL
ncbi:MAG: ABC transporter permease, partial [Anaerolineales bacterium]